MMVTPIKNSFDGGSKLQSSWVIRGSPNAVERLKKGQKMTRGKRKAADYQLLVSSFRVQDWITGATLGDPNVLRARSRRRQKISPATVVI